jgi:alpha-beta hydrolase superfamily lysophospholipase
LHDPDIKASVLQRVHKKVTSETKVIVAHSLGSIVAYEALCMNDDWHVDTLITLGSPLGIRNLVFDALTPKPKDGRAIWPRVRRWVNIVDQGDIVALEKHLAPYFGNVEDKVVYNGWHSHDVTRYLCTRETGEAISAVLGES